VFRTYNVHIMCHWAKFHKHRLNHGRDMVIFILFKMAATAILDFQSFNFSTVRAVKRVELHQFAKFHRNRSNSGQDMVFLYFQNGGRRHLAFSKFRIFNGRTHHESRTASPYQIYLKSFEPRPRYVSFNIMLVWL